MSDNNNWSEDERILASLMTNGLYKLSADPCPSIEQMAQLVEGTLPEDERDAILKHVAGCDRCYDTLKVSRELHHPGKVKRPLYHRPWALAASIVIVVLSAVLFYQIGIDKSDLSEPVTAVEESELRPAPKGDSRTYTKSMKDAPSEKRRTRSKLKKGEKTWDEYPRGTAHNIVMEKEGQGSRGKDHKAGKMEDKKSESEGKTFDRLGYAQKVEKETLKRDRGKDKKLSGTLDREKEKQSQKIAGKQLPPVAKAPARKVQQKDDREWNIDGINVQQEGAPAKLNQRRAARCFTRDRFSQSTQFSSGRSRRQLPRVQAAPVLVDAKNLPQPAPIDGLVSLDVLLDMEIDSQGNVMGICVEKGLSYLTQKMVDRLFSWKFQPVTRGGKPISARFRASLIFDFSENRWLFNGHPF